MTSKPASVNSAFSRGWELAKRRYEFPPHSEKVSHFDAPQWMNTTQQQSFKDGYLAWCSGKYHGRSK